MSFDRLSVWLGRKIGSPRVFLAVLAIILLKNAAAAFVPAWRDTINIWSGALSGDVSILMLLALGSGQNRAAAAQQAKSDEIIRIMPEARNELIRAEDLSERQIEAMRATAL